MLQIPRWKQILIVAVCAWSLLYAMPNLWGGAWMRENLPAWMPGKTVNLGLDLRGGAHLLYEVDVNSVFAERANMMVADLRTELRKANIGYTRIGVFENGVRVTLRNEADGETARKILRTGDPNVTVTTNGAIIDAKPNDTALKQVYDQTIAQSIEIVRRRVDELGTTEPMIARQGNNRILIQAPGANAQQLKAIIGTTAKLNFHLVVAPTEDNRRNLLTLPMEEDEFQNLTVEKRPVISGDMLDNAQPGFNNGEPIITFRLNNVGARRFCDITRKHTGEPFAIVLDEKILSAPRINEAICGGSGQISGAFTVQSASNLAMLLRSGALPAPMNVVEERTVGPSLGADSVGAGKTASIFGLIFVLTFMFISYGFFGILANVALLINIIMIFAILSCLQATLTMPGIAGIVLTMGMAVDANVLIFERIREEHDSGRSVYSAIDTGYKQAQATITDSNLTGLIAALILFMFGTGTIKGFAITLGVGILTSMFTAVLVTRLLVVWWLRWAKPKDIPV